MHHIKRIGVGWILLGIALLTALPLLADGSLFGTIAGRVKDESGGALPGATVELTSVEKGFKRSVTTDAAGAFNFALLPPGHYTLKGTLQGFDTYVATDNVVIPEKTTSL